MGVAFCCFEGRGGRGSGKNSFLSPPPPPSTNNRISEEGKGEKEAFFLLLVFFYDLMQFCQKKPRRNINSSSSTKKKRKKNSSNSNGGSITQQHRHTPSPHPKKVNLSLEPEKKPGGLVGWCQQERGSDLSCQQMPLLHTHTHTSSPYWKWRQEPSPRPYLQKGSVAQRKKKLIFKKRVSHLYFFGRRRVKAGERETHETVKDSRKEVRRM